MKYAMFTAFALALGLTACGGTEPPPNAAGGPGMGSAPGGKPEAMKGPVGDFHAVLSPVYHADKGAERTAKVCEQGATMHDKAAAVESGAAPDGAKADDYKAAAKNLTTAVDGLVAACAAAGRPDVDAKLEALHDAFHKLIEVPGVMPAKHDEHGDHHDHH